MVLQLPPEGGGGGGRLGQKHCFHFDSHLQNLIMRRLCDIIIRSGHVVSVTSLHGEHSHSFKMTLKLLQEKQSFYITTCNTFPPSTYLTTDFIRTTFENEIARDL